MGRLGAIASSRAESFAMRRPARLWTMRACTVVSFLRSIQILKRDTPTIVQEPCLTAFEKIL
jgi:hypothetical protein